MPIQQMLLGGGGIVYETNAVWFSEDTSWYGNEVKCASSSDFAFGTGAYTIEFYIKIQSDFTPAGSHVVICEMRPDAGNGAYVTLYFNGDNQLTFYGGTANSVGEVIAKHADTAVPFGEWVHVALVRESTSSNKCKLYINGTSGSNAKGTDTQNYGNQELKFGGAHAWNTVGFKGFVSNYRVTKGQALYTSNFTPSFAPLTTTSQGATSSNVKFLAAQSRNPLAATVSPHTLTKESSNPPDSSSNIGPIEGRGVDLIPDGGSVEFYKGGTIDAIRVPNIPDFGTSNFTIECFINSDEVDRSNSTIMDTATNYTHANGAFSGAWWALHKNQDGIVFAANDSAFINATGYGYISANTWHHVAVTRDSNDFEMWIDGVYAGGVSSTHNFTDSITRTLSIGNQWQPDWSSSRYFNGHISNVRITIGQALYTTNNFTPPASVLQPTSQSATASNVKFIGCVDEASPLRVIKKPTGTITTANNPKADSINPF